MADAEPLNDAEACELTIRRASLGVTTGRSQASAPLSLLSPTADELAGEARSQGGAPAQPAASPAGGPVAPSEQAGEASREDHEFRNPSLPSRRRQTRAFLFALLCALRFLSAPRTAACRVRRIAYVVEVVRRAAQRAAGGTHLLAFYRGVLRCGSVWECPVCMFQIRTERAKELSLAVIGWGYENVLMLSLTVRHGLGDDLRTIRAGISEAFKGVINGNPWKRFKAKFGFQYQVRALETTHGRHGWHPHLHVLFFLETPLSETELESARIWFNDRWARSVRKVLGASHVPNEHGVDLRKVNRADYLAKLGLELLDPGTKRARGKNRTPLQIAVGAASGKSPADEALWRTYCDAMRGAKMLTWSRGLRKAAGLEDEKSDEEIANEGDALEAEEIAVLAGHVWDGVRYRPGLPCAILDAAELAPNRSDAAEAVQALIWANDFPSRSST